MKEDFLSSYFEKFDSIQGFFSRDAALMFMGYNQLINSQGVSGHVLEIGVHHGLSAITIASLAGHGQKFIAVDLFEDRQDSNVSASGSGSQHEFLRNMRTFFPSLDFLQIITAPSADLSANELGVGFSFCHIDGGHSPEETYQDLDLCSRILMPGGLVALDDYFNPSFPGVSEGAIRFAAEQNEKLKPIAIGFNKVLFQKNPVTADLNSAFAATFKGIPKTISVLWNHPVHHFTTGFVPFFDVDSSSPRSLVLKPEPTIYASLEPLNRSIEIEPDRIMHLPVRVCNKSPAPFPFGKATFGLSYHLLTFTGDILKYDNQRSYFEAPLQPDTELTVELEVRAPSQRGSYLLEIDLVWEGMLWFKEKGNPTSLVELKVS
jgi:predicted O-methyltransferase YrrM